jgi:hypothetical protein
VARCVSWAQAAAWAVVFLGETFCRRFAVPAPRWMTSMCESKFNSALVAFWVGNIAMANTLNTGAFEVFYAGDLVSSKLATRELPKMNVIFDAIRGAGR